jgi:hypothetical protein
MSIETLIAGQKAELLEGGPGVVNLSPGLSWLG